MFVNAGDIFVECDVVTRTMSYVHDLNALYFGKVRLVDCTGRLTWEVPIMPASRDQPPASYLPHHQSVIYPKSYYAARNYDPAMGYRADVEFTGRACSALPRHFTGITTVQSTLGGTSSRAIASLAALRKELPKETAYARHIAATTGRRGQLVGVAVGVLVKYLASKTGGTPLVHRLMYTKHVVKSRLALWRGD
jgi:hypothetical protein